MRPVRSAPYRGAMSNPGENGAPSEQYGQQNPYGQPPAQDPSAQASPYGQQPPA